MGQITLSGALIAGPPSSGDGVFPGSLINAPLSFILTPKQFGVATGVLTRLLNSPGSFVTLDGVGAAATVTKGDTLYLKTNAQVDLRLTIDNGVGGTDLRIVTVSGLVVLEFSTSRSLKLLEAQGSATIEYFVSGQS